MKIQYIKATWGMPVDEPIESQLKRIKAAGYDGVETGLPPVSPAEWEDLLAKYGLVYIGMCFPFTIADAVSDLENLAKYKPLLVDFHGGRDSMTFEEGSAFFQEVLAAEKALGLRVGHETHRGRLLYAPWVTTAYLNAFPDLKLTIDFSHWCVVCESLLANLDEHVKLASERAIHIHGRVGYAEGPQVPDPSAPEYAEALAAHESWWDRVLEMRRADGTEVITFNPEFGPPAYMHTLPHTNQPVANLWDVCHWMMKRQRSRWS